MKETNMEHFRGEIERIIEDSGEIPSFIDGMLGVCKGNQPCHKCGFGGNGDCGVAFIKWAMSEYKPEPVLTEREKHFVEFVQTGYIARDSDGRIDWHEKKPNKRDRYWLADGGRTNSIRVFCYDNLFCFVTWEDEEPWAVEDLRKLKVGDQDA